jgi:hypothetical protein
LGSRGQTINYSNNQDDFDDHEEFDDFNDNDEEEFMKIEDSNRSYQILPLNNLKAHNDES